MSAEIFVELPREPEFVKHIEAAERLGKKLSDVVPDIERIYLGLDGGAFGTVFTIKAIWPDRVWAGTRLSAEMVFDVEPSICADLLAQDLLGCRAIYIQEGKT